MVYVAGGVTNDTTGQRLVVDKVITWGESFTNQFKSRWRNMTLQTMPGCSKPTFLGSWQVFFKPISRDEILLPGVKLISVGGRPTVVGRCFLSPCKLFLMVWANFLCGNLISIVKGMEKSAQSDFSAIQKIRLGFVFNTFNICLLCKELL